MTLKRIRGFVWLIRPKNALMMGLAVLVSGVIALRGQAGPEHIRPLFLGFVTSFALTGSAMCVNDFFDREIDAENEPDRPIPSGLVRLNEAIYLALMLTVLGLFSALFTSLPNLLMAIAAFIIAGTYSYRKSGKKRGFSGNCMVSLCIALPFFYGALAVGRSFDELLIIFAMLAFLSNLGREVTKGIVDREGDEPQGVRTLAVLYGEKTAAVVAVSLYLSSVALSFLPWMLRLVSSLYLPVVMVADAIFVVLSLSLLSNYSRMNARRVKDLVLLSMLMGLIAFVIGGAS